MWHDEAGPLRRLLVLAALAAVCGCASSAAFAERQGQRPRSSVLRLATERGIKDLSNDTLRWYELQFEVRAEADSVTLPGCSVRLFSAPDLDEFGFTLDSIVEDTSLVVFDGTASEARRRVDAPREAAIPPAVLRQAAPVVTVPPGQARFVTLTVMAARSVLGRDEIGIRLDSSPEALSFARGEGCHRDVKSVDSDYVEHYLLPTPLTIDSGAGALAMAAGLLLIIIIVTGR